MWNFTYYVLLAASLAVYCQSYPIILQELEQQSWESEPYNFNAIGTENIMKRGLPQINQIRKEPTSNCNNGCDLDYNGRVATTPNDFQEPIPSKKNVFMSRGWGAGGMPFSVLYMAHHKPISARPQAQALSAARKQLPESEAMNQNGDGETPHGVPSRRQYSIIPQLFVSYGWGPLGK